MWVFLFLMPGKLQEWFNRNIWETGLPTINGGLLQSILDGGDYTDEVVTVRKGLRIATVYTCVNVISKTICSLPLGIFREEGKNKIALTDHSAYYPLAQQPNKYMSSANFWLTIVLHAISWGNGFAYINRDSRMRPVSFDLWETWEVTIKKVNGELFYTYKGETVPARDVFHLRLYSLDGICGLSPILENSDTMGMAMKLKRYSSLLMGVQPPGVLSYEGNLTPEQRAENKKEWSGGSKGAVKILSARWKYQPIMTPADESQYNVTKSANEREIYGIWQIPPTFAQNFERATFSNAEQSDLVYAKHTITPIVTVIEKELNMKVFFEREKANTYTKFNMNGLLRGDIAARKEFYQSMVNTGVMSRNEARSYEDMNPYEGGDDFLVQGAMVPADMLRKHYENQLLPTAATKPTQTKNYINGNGQLVN